MTSSVNNESTIFAVIRHGDKEKPGDNPPLTEKGLEEARIAGPALKLFLAEMLGRKNIQLIASTLTRTQQTARLMAQGMEIPESEIVSDARIRERVHVKDPVNPQKESTSTQVKRMKEGIEAGISGRASLDTVPVFVSHSLVECAFRKSTGEKDREMLHHLKTCEVVVYSKQGDKYSVMAVVRPDFTPAAKL
jgi:bisphosphoglycerate-dependent phosphoglycerate mutase